MARKNPNRTANDLRKSTSVDESVTSVLTTSGSSLKVNEKKFKFLITTIDVEYVKDGSNNKVEGISALTIAEKVRGHKVTFHGDIKPNKDGIYEVSYLMDVKPVSEGSSILEGLIVDRKDFINAMKVVIDVQARKGRTVKFLACIHGLDAEPHGYWNTCKTIENVARRDDLSISRDLVVIPVMWANELNSKNGSALFLIHRYLSEKKHSLAAGMALSSIADLGGEDIPISIMCHSMGNRVLLTYAYEQERDAITKRFEHIFMVAADVWEEVFNTGVVSNKACHPKSDFGDAGLKLRYMLKDGGKIHILKNPGDIMLRKSVLLNGFRTRLGRFGKEGQDTRGRLHKEIKDALVDHDMGFFGSQHVYDTYQESVDIYCEQMFD